ncbi:MAG: DUF4838 domain-containing protein [Armatimonadota bacterium]|nr:MAG: DUF4838 domain-containing protein [Armatimonadota bacterium]
MHATLSILAAVVIMALCAAAPAAADAIGISRIAAEQGKLAVSVHVPPGTGARLVELRPYERYAPGGDAAVLWQGKSAGAAIEIPRFDGARDRLFSKFQLADAHDGAALGNAHYVDDLSALPRRDFELPWPDSIKGLQVQMVDDAIALGVKHAGINVMLPSVVDLSGASQETWEVDGEEIHINTGYVNALDATFKPLTGAGINVTAILLNGVPTQPDANNPFIHPSTDLANAPTHLGAFNTTDERGLRHYRAAIEYLANRYSEPDAEHGWVSGYIIGNEVQAHWEWYNIGRMPLDDFVQDYGIALRVADLAARRFHPQIRIYVSLTHHWKEAYSGDPLKGFPGKDFLDRLNAWSKAEGDFPWHVAFHPYPENLMEPRTWQDRRAVPSYDTPKVTFKNIEVLPAYMRQERMLCNGAPRRIILSEQGFHTPDGPDGEEIQAAAYAYAYYRLSRTPGIDAFILHRHVDHKQEGGLRLGLWTWKDDGGLADPDRKKPIYEVFRLADTDQWEQAFEFAKPIIGITHWEEILPSAGIEVSADPTAALEIVSHGESGYRIVTPDEPEPVVEYAARELQHFLAEISGATLPIVGESAAGDGPAFLIGPSRRATSVVSASDLAGLAEDGVLIRTAGRDVALMGEDARGQLYSVYVLLERFLGVRFLARDCTVVPRREVVVLPRIDYAYSPPFMYRETLYFDSFPKQIATRQRLNGPMTQCDEEVGGRIAFHPYVHSFGQLVPPEKYYDEHPEYFSLVGGTRTNAVIHGQLCLTNPDVLRIATEQVLKWIEEHPEVPIFDVSQNDGGGACECENCTAVVNEEGSQHGPILRFVNAIADAVKEQHPEKWIETLAYAYSTKPPALTKPRDNVIIRLCHGGCYFHGFEVCGLGANLAGYVDEWRKLTRRIFIWHYATNFAHYIAPNQNLDGLARDIKFYAAHGVNGLMVQADYQSPGGELAELRQYLAAQLMWDPRRDPEMIRLEFCDGYYGAAADDVLRYLRLTDEAARRSDVHAFGAWDPQNTVTPEFVADGLRILTRARTRANSPEVANRVARLLLPLWYVQLSYPERYGLTPADGAQVVRDFRAVVEANLVTHVREGGENMAGWLTEQEARYAAVPQSVVYDLYLNMGHARREHCLDWRAETIEAGDRVLLTIFQHPPAEGDGDATYGIDLPALEAAGKLVLRFATGFTGPTENGVRFAVLVDGAEVWAGEQRGLAPVEHEVDLSAWAGKAIDLTLRVNALGNERYDWANWVRPQVVVAR